MTRNSSYATEEIKQKENVPEKPIVLTLEHYKASQVSKVSKLQKFWSKNFKSLDVYLSYSLRTYHLTIQ